MIVFSSLSKKTIKKNSVFKAVYRKNIVAVKEFMFSLSSSDEASKRQFVKELENEITMLGNLRHRNILNFIGACIQPPRYAIITEFIDGGSLFDFLYNFERKSEHVGYGFRQKVSLILQISQACLFLHQQSIIHRDLKSHNVLLDGVIPTAIIPKISDFGLAKAKSSTQNAELEMTQAVGSPLWMAPYASSHFHLILQNGAKHSIK